MDVKFYQNKKRCSLHPSHQLEFIQINNTIQTKDKSLFYCVKCVDDDLLFQAKDYIGIDTIVNYDHNLKILNKWPPLNDLSILGKLKIESNQSSKETIFHKIESYFENLLKEVASSIQILKKQTFVRLERVLYSKEDILRKYNEVSKIQEFQTLVNESTNNLTNTDDKKCRQFIEQMELVKDRNTLALQNLLVDHIGDKDMINFEIPNLYKESVLSQIRQINFFNRDDNYQQEESELNQQRYSTLIDKLMSLVSNKSNFCSEQFLISLQNSLITIAPLLSSIKFDNQFQQNKVPIPFSQLTNHQFELVEKYVNHCIKLNSSNNSFEEFKNKNEVKQMKSILNNGTNFINQQFKNSFQNYLVNTYPFLAEVDFLNCIRDADKFNSFQNLSNDSLEDFTKLAQKLSYFMNGGGFTNCISLKIIDNQSLNLRYFKYIDVYTLLKHMPVFDLLQTNIQSDLLGDLQLQKSTFRSSTSRLEIEKQSNNEIDIQLNSDGEWVNCVSNIKIEKNLKYIFRIQIKQLQPDYQNRKDFILGLMQEKNINTQYGYLDYLCCYLIYWQNVITKYSTNYGLFTSTKGTNFKLSDENIIEMRVSLSEQLLEVLDYPNYTHKLSVTDQFKQNLTNHQNLRLYLGFNQRNIKFTIKDALIVKDFAD